MKITVVTVCYNAQDTIEETIRSVLAQQFESIEYLIIDGKSTDKTCSLIKQFEMIPWIKVISEKDTGLYNAMNKGIKLAQGDYIIFLNSGDVFADAEVLKDIAPHLQKDIVFGNVIRRKKQGEVLEKYKGTHQVLPLLLQGRMMSHQVIFTKTSVMQKYGFDESFHITADFDFLVRARRDRCTMKYINRTVSIMENRQGISSQADNLEQMRQEDDRSLKKHFPVYYYFLKPIKSIARGIKDRQV